MTTFKKKFKISGQIGDSRQKDQLSFSSLAHQINAGLNRGYKEEEVIEAVINAVNPGLRLRTYLEGKPDLTLANVCKILRSHYQEKESKLLKCTSYLVLACKGVGRPPRTSWFAFLTLNRKNYLLHKRQNLI